MTPFSKKNKKPAVITCIAPEHWKLLKGPARDLYTIPLLEMITEAGNKAWPLERMLCLLCANQLPQHLFTARIAVKIPSQVTQRIVKPLLG